MKGPAGRGSTHGDFASCTRPTGPNHQTRLPAMPAQESTGWEELRHPLPAEAPTACSALCPTALVGPAQTPGTSRPAAGPGPGTSVPSRGSSRVLDPRAERPQQRRDPAAEALGCADLARPALAAVFHGTLERPARALERGPWGHRHPRQRFPAEPVFQMVCCTPLPPSGQAAGPPTGPAPVRSVGQGTRRKALHPTGMTPDGASVVIRMRVLRGLASSLASCKKRKLPGL